MKREQLVVVISGASTEIGYSLATELAADGNEVYAGARKEEDIEKLSGIQSLSMSVHRPAIMLFLSGLLIIAVNGQLRHFRIA